MKNLQQTTIGKFTVQMTEIQANSEELMLIDGGLTILGRITLPILRWPFHRPRPIPLPWPIPGPCPGPLFSLNIK